MIVVVDSSVLVGACRGSPACAAVAAACIRGEHSPLMGAALLAELESVFARDEPWRSARLGPRERGEVLDAFLASCAWTRIYFAWRPNLRDEGDNHLIELAVAGGADRIITRNSRDFAGMELKFPRILVVTPESFLKEIR
ncbi:MAG: hypothetical protein HMLKMBBP_00405 [Planctomycetes bacterium]|nr:hypothetical protein [Planctomycetota bacterium]